jgi:diguanylate cyclase
LKPGAALVDIRENSEAKMAPRVAEQEDWRRKYYDSLKAVDEEGRQSRAQLETLYKLVGRLCLAAQGQSPRMDDELRRLRDAVRKHVPFGTLEPMSQAIADILHELDDTARTVRRTAPASGAAVDSSPQPPAATPAAPANLLPLEPGTRAVLSLLLAELAREPQLASEAEAIDAGLSARMTDEGKLQLIERVAGLVMQRISMLEKSRKDMEALLGQMLGQLDSLTHFIAGQNAEESERSSATATLNVKITGEVRAIGESVASGTDVAQIRTQLRERLESISQHLKTYRQREEERSRMSLERNARMRARMSEMESEARALQARLSTEKRLSLLDPLTRIANRMAWDQRFAAECERWRRFRQPTCIAAWDIDRFKVINDSYGHRAGDRVLTVVAEALSREIRGTDFVARYGGEEFVMLLPGTSLDDGVRLANRMRESVAQIGFHFRGNPVGVTISCGITMLRDGDADDDAFDRADKAMYMAKQGGRNRVVNI